MAVARRVWLHAAWIAPLVALALPLAAYQFPSMVGADEALIVLTGSMEPTLSPGDIVFVERVSIADVVEGDVVNFSPTPHSQTTYTHRVVRIVTDQRGTVLTTKGDANEDPDPMGVNAELLRGRVVHTMPALGRLIALFHARLVPLVLAAGGLLVVAIELRGWGAKDETKPVRFTPARPATRFVPVSDPATARVVAGDTSRGARP